MKPGRVEIVSNVIPAKSNWLLNLGLVFEALHGSFNVKLTIGCSMHVHVSPRGPEDTGNDKKYTIAQIKGIMKAVFFFDDAITRIMPADRKENAWAISNAKAPKTPARVRNAYSAVNQKSWGPLFAIIDKVKSTGAVNIELAGNRYMSWNFGNLADQCGTVEFRRPPGVDSADKAMYWVAFTLGFVAGALSTQWIVDQTSTTIPSVIDLGIFIQKGVDTQGEVTAGAADFTRMVEDTSPATVYTVQELEEIERKKTAKAQRLSPFVEVKCCNLIYSFTSFY